MKKLKIFLLLSILLCFGFALTSEVYAEEITDLTGTKWLLPESIDTTPSIINYNFDIEISPYEIDLNTLLKLHPNSGDLDSITTWEELLDLIPYFITDMGGTNVVNNLVIENDKNNYLIVPTKGYLKIYSSESYSYLYYGLDLTSADNLPVVSGTLTFEHPIDGTLSFNFVDLFDFFFIPSISWWDEIPILNTIADPLFSTMTITGGDDVTNPTLIAWLEANATQIIDEPSGPKLFEVGDVLPATTRLRIRWINNIRDIPNNSYIYVDNGSLDLVSKNSLGSVRITSIIIYNAVTGVYKYPYTPYYGNHPYCDIDTSTWDLNSRTIFSISSGMEIFTWEDLNAPQTPSNAKPFEEGDILPAGYIKISWDFTGIPIPDKAVTFMVSSGDDVFNDLIIEIDFNFGGYDHLKIFNGGSVEHFNVDTPGFTIITLTESVTITDLGGSDGITFLDYNVYIGDALTWEVISQDYLNGFTEAREIYGFRYMNGPWMTGEAAWNHGYDKGSEETWEEGFEYGTERGMETFGYYDPITEQWLSVEEYLDLYGTDKLNQSDFYNNFDKYFIPAMIIVFGGAIVLTILKVFKGRE